MSTKNKKLTDVERVVALRNLPIFKFEPTNSMQPFADDTGRRIFCRAGNRLGKTYTGTYKLAVFALDNPNSRCRVVGPTFKVTNTVMSRYLYEFLKPWLVEDCTYSPTRGFIHQTIRLTNGTTIQMLSNDQNIRVHAGEALDYVYIDEPPSNDIFVENIQRTIERRGRVVMSTTPVGAPLGWLRDIIEDPESEWSEHVVEFSAESSPWLTQEEVDAAIKEASLDPLTFNQRIYAAWEGATVDRYMTAFLGECILTEIGASDNCEWRYYIGIDHGELKSHQVAILIAHNLTEDKIYCLDEYVSQSVSSINDDAKGILDMVERNNMNLHEIDSMVGDINSAGKAAPSKSVNQLLTKALGELAGYSELRIPYNLQIRKPNKRKGSVAYGERLINMAFNDNHLYVHEDCKTLIKCLTHYNGQENLKHSIDALRYILTPELEKLFGKSKGQGKINMNYN